MRLGEIPAGTSVFVDANIFVYAFAEDKTFGPPCIDFLERIELRDLTGCVSALILSEVAHRLMTLEACETFGWPYAGIAQRLRRHPDHVQKLRRFRDALEGIAAIGLSTYAISDQDVFRAAALSQQHGLLSNDALVASVMQQHSIAQLASNDEDFDRIPDLTRYAPT
jgi:predicted nucleic acid-binding protein